MSKKHQAEITDFFPKKTKKRKRTSDSEEKEENNKKRRNLDEEEESSIEEIGSVFQHLTDETWRDFLGGFLEGNVAKKIDRFLEKEHQGRRIVFPPREDVFTAFNMTPLSELKAVVIGQDPYFREGQGHGLSFSVRKGVKVPPSLNRIYNVLVKDIPGFKKPKHGYLAKWAEQGVLMLNATLTVRSGTANTHKTAGWQDFTDHVIQKISDEKENIVFFLWGKFAQKKGVMVDSSKHCILEGPHPSPMSGSGWNDVRHFSEANAYLESKGIDPIDWIIE